MRITVCGGGNAAHTLVGVLASQPGLQVNLFTPYGEEALLWQESLAQAGDLTLHTPQGVLHGRPQVVSDRPEAAVAGADLVLLSLPAFAHEAILEQIAPHLASDAWVGVLPARGGFDFSVRRIFARHDSLVVFGLQTLPWACRILQYGREARILGTKASTDLAAWPPARTGEVSVRLSQLLGVHLDPIANFLSLTLAGTGQIIHPGIMYGLFHAWEGETYAQAPLFYQNVDAYTANVLQQLSDEIQALRRDLEDRYPHLDLSAVRPLKEWVLRAYPQDIEDPATLQTCFTTNRAYEGLRAPVQPVDGRLAPNFKARYLSEDVPYGLVVSRGIAELAGVQTPAIQQVITWSQARLEQTYLMNGRLVGVDVNQTRAPQRYGFTQLDPFMQAFYPRLV